MTTALVFALAVLLGCAVSALVEQRRDLDTLRAENERLRRELSEAQAARDLYEQEAIDLGAHVRKLEARPAIHFDVMTRETINWN